MTTFVAEKTLPMDVIRIDGGTQSRTQIHQYLVDEYAEKMADGSIFPPGVAFFDGKEYWLANGFHRYHALRKNNKHSMVCSIVNGTVRDAILYSKSANSLNGLRLSLEDRKHNVMEMLQDFEWNKWGDREIARYCDCSHTFVSKLRATLETPQPDKIKYRAPDGEIYERTRKPKKTSAAGPVKVTVPEPVAQVTDKHDEKQEAIEYLIEENEKLKDQLASATSDDPAFAKEHIEELRAELKQAKIELSAVTKSRDMYQAECAQLKKQVASYQRQLKKAA